MNNLLLDDQQLGKILLQESYISEDDLDSALELVNRSAKSLMKTLYDLGFLNDSVLGSAMAEFYKVPHIDLDIQRPDVEDVLELPEEVAREFRVVVVKKDGHEVVFATDNPQADGLEAALKKVFASHKIVMNFSLPSDIDKILLYYRPSVTELVANIIEEDDDVAPRVLDVIFEEAIKMNSSDIHLEPSKEKVFVRFRVDGVLTKIVDLPLGFYKNVLNRLKVLSGLRIDDHFSAQDGALHYQMDNVDVDMRISIVPTLDGEKVVIRLLTAYIENLTMDKLGLSEENRMLLENAAKKPFGMIIVTGPTGSGKTTTLYSIIRVLNRPEVNITTIEDPVEYKVVGINQIQVNRQTNLNFASGLRSIVRQDPDVILVGEIRDEETAEIGVNAAMTGHLLLSTFHANDAVTAIPRLIDMGVEPFLLASILEVIIGQRLVRKICSVCKVSTTISKKNLEEKYGSDVCNYLGVEKDMILFKGKGCPVCDNTGYDGRTAIFEFVNIDNDVSDLILKNPSSNEIWKVARKNGAKSMFEDGVEKVKSGVTTLEELYRVCEPPKYEK